MKGIFSRHWISKNPKADLVLIHGLAEHSGRYQPLADFLNQEGYSVHAFDLRGHGRSEGARSYIDSLEDFLADIDHFIDSNRLSKFFLLGHSFGGQLAINYTATRKDRKILGLVLSSPNIRLKMAISRIKIATGTLLSRLTPHLLLASEIPFDFISHDKELVRATKRDPLVQTKITVRLGDLILKNQEILLGLARQIRCPTLILQGGDDRITALEGARDFFREISIEDKEFKIYEGFYHEVFNEVGRQQVFKDLADWVQRHS